MCVPVSLDELHAAVVDMDMDGNGLIELAEFTQYFISLGMGDEKDPAAGYEDEEDSDVRTCTACRRVAGAGMRTVRVWWR
jgi:hypothetical protein